MEKIYKACDENQELKENYFLKINKNVLKKDLKEINAIEKLFQYFISEQVDVENGKSAKLLYEELGWNQNVSYDVINSFWITLILSILVDTFISKISFPMQPGPEIGSISDA